MTPYPDFPKDKFRVRVRHYSQSSRSRTNVNDNFVTTAKYVTELTLFSATCRGQFDVPLFTVYAKCNNKDIPRRKEGFRVAYQKAVIVATALNLI